MTTVISDNLLLLCIENQTRERKEEETKNSPKGNYQMEEKDHLLGNRHWTEEREVEENNSHRGNEQKEKKNRKIVLIKVNIQKYRFIFSEVWP